MNRPGHYQIRLEATLHRAIQIAIADELRARYEPPRELTRELSGVMTKLDDPEIHDRGQPRNIVLEVKAPRIRPFIATFNCALGECEQKH
jgi:hypothetical protein